jgi:hypothetical protein
MRCPADGGDLIGTRQTLFTDLDGIEPEGAAVSGWTALRSASGPRRRGSRSRTAGGYPPNWVVESNVATA